LKTFCVADTGLAVPLASSGFAAMCDAGMHSVECPLVWSVERDGRVVLQVSGTGPLDAAAHLKLLGESLSVIGARLQEHKVSHSHT